MTTNFRQGTWSEKIYLLGQDVFEKSSNKDVARMIGCSNEGIVSRERKTVAEKTGWNMPVGRQAAQETTTAQPSQQAAQETTTAQPSQQPAAKPRKGSLPAKIEGFLVGLLDEVPETLTPEHVVPVIEADEVSWNRFIRRMADLDEAMVESFERWLGRGATLSRQCAFDEAIETAAQWDRKSRAETLARELIELGYGDKSPTAILREIWL